MITRQDKYSFLLRLMPNIVFLMVSYYQIRLSYLAIVGSFVYLTITCLRYHMMSMLLVSSLLLPLNVHWVVLCILRYLRCTIFQSFFFFFYFSSTSSSLRAYCDINHDIKAISHTMLGIGPKPICMTH